MEQSEDSASDDDDCDFGSEHNFSVYALTRQTPAPKKICAINRFTGLDDQQEYDPDVLAALNNWAHNVKVSTKKPKKSKVSGTIDAKLDRTANYVTSNKKPNDIISDVIVKPRSEKETDAIVSRITAALPSNTIATARAARKIGNWDLEEGEMIALVDTGSFTHAVDADVEFPDHEVVPCDPDAPGTAAEAADGGILKKLGTVRTTGVIDGVDVEVVWDHRKVSTPILSVRKLVKDGNDVYINKKGGFIKNMATGKVMKVYNFQGVYYLRMKVTSGKQSGPSNKSDFHRPGR